MMNVWHAVRIATTTGRVSSKGECPSSLSDSCSFFATATEICPGATV